MAPMVQVWAKVPIEWRSTLQNEANQESLDLSDVVRKAIRAYVHGGAEKLADVMRQERAKNAIPETSPSVREFGEWMVALEEPIRVKVYEIGQALTLLYAQRDPTTGELRLPGGTVKNTFVPARNAGKARSAVTASKRRRAPAT